MLRQLIRPAWHRLTPYRLAAARQLERAMIRARALPDRWLREPWPAGPGSAISADNVAIVTVNYNTAEKLAHLLFSLYRILGRDQFSKIVVVDNKSTDGSRNLLEALQCAGLVEAILNRKQRYHGPALNQALNFLARNARGSGDSIRYVWILDSDTVVLRRDTVACASRSIREQRAGVIGQLNFDIHSLPAGYAHVCSLFVDPRLVWKRSVEPFQESGTPAEGLEMSLARRGICVGEFPFMRENYVLHLGAATVATVRDQAEARNRYHDWSRQAPTRHFHGNPDGQAIYDAFTALFHSHVPTLSADRLVEVCLPPELLTLGRHDPDATARLTDALVHDAGR